MRFTQHRIARSSVFARITWKEEIYLAVKVDFLRSIVFTTLSRGHRPVDFSLSKQFHNNSCKAKNYVSQLHEEIIGMQQRSTTFLDQGPQCIIFSALGAEDKIII